MHKKMEIIDTNQMIVCRVISTAKNVELRGFYLTLKTQPIKMRIPHNQQLGHT